VARGGKPSSAPSAAGSTSPVPESSGAGSPPAAPPADGGASPPPPSTAKAKPAAAGGGGSLPAPPAFVNEGAGVLLAVVAWGWLVMPFLVGGMPRVRQVLKAKFLNRAADGSWLP
jgi:hypothetical protein